MVRTRGLEPPHLAAPDPKSGVSTNSTTSAWYFVKRSWFVKVVRPSGFEPETYGLEGRCSIQLSYGRIKVVRPIGFEPITVGSEVRYSIQLSHGRMDNNRFVSLSNSCYIYSRWGGIWDSNPRPSVPQTDALTN